MDLWSEYTRFSIELFTITAPFVGIPMFLGLTERMSARGRATTATAATVTMLVLLLIAQYAGTAIITGLGTTLPSFQIAGGLIITLAGFGMLRSEGSGSGSATAHGDAEAVKVGVVPLGIPLMAGPGTITAVILESQHAHPIDDSGAVSAIIVGVSAVIWVLYLLAVPIGRALGPTGLNILTRLFGLVLTAIGIEIITRGVMKHVANFIAGM